MRDSSKTKAWKLLEWIGRQRNGVTLTEIQFYIWKVLENKPGIDFWETSGQYNGSYYDQDPNINNRQSRGLWTTQLYGGMHYHGGLLHMYCKKVNRKWVLNKMPNKNEVIYKDYFIDKELM